MSACFRFSCATAKLNARVLARTCDRKLRASSLDNQLNRGCRCVQSDRVERCAADLLSCDTCKDCGGTRVRSAAAAPEMGAQRDSNANFASVAPKRAHRSTRRHQNRRRGMRGSHPGTILSERAAAPVATVAYNRRCRRCLVDGPVFIPGDHRLHDCSAQQAKCDVTPGERSPLAARNLARVGAFP